MRKLLCVLVAFVLCGPLCATDARAAETGVQPPTHSTTPGLEAAKALSLITGVAISPLLGVGAVGAYRYFTAPPAARAGLPWFAQPWFWLPALLIVGLVGLKDVAGAALPPGLKKPLDALEVIENKISGLIAAGAFVPLVVSIFGHGLDGSAITPPLGGWILAMSDSSVIGNILVIPVAIALFGLVWITSHAITILILLSPWGVVDAALKSARVFLMSLVVGLSFIHPYAGAVLSILILIVAYFLAGWSFRLTVCGTVFVWDILTLHHARFEPKAEANWMFLAQETSGAPIRTYGKLARKEDGGFTFNYRPWLVLPQLTLTLERGHYAIGRGLFYPEVLKIEAPIQMVRCLFMLPPRHRTHEPRLGQIYRIDEIRDVGLLKGFKAIWTWMAGLFGFRPASP